MNKALLACFRMTDFEPALLQIFDQTLAEIYIADAETNRFVYANKSGLDNLGYSLEEIQQLSGTQVTIKYSESEFFEVLEPLILGDINSHLQPYDNVHLRKDGTTYPVEAQVQKINFNGRPCYMAIVNDVTEKKRLLEQMELVIKGGEIGYWDRHLVDGTFEINDRSLQILGRTREEINDKIESWLALIHPDDFDRVVNQSEERARTTKSWSSEYRMQHKDGHWVWILGTSSIVARNPTTGEAERICGTHIDITDRKTGEKEREEFFRFFEISSDIMIMADLEGKFLQVNSAVNSLLGYNIEEMVNQPILDFVHPDDREKTMDDIELLLKQGYSFDQSNRYLHKDGSYRWLSWRSTYDPVNKRVFGMARDITEQKKVAEELHKQQEKYRVLAENNEDVIMQYDRQHRHIYINPAVSRLLPFTPENFLGKTHSDMGFPAELCAMWKESIEKCFVTGTSNSAIFDADSLLGLRTLDWKVFPELDSDGKVVTVFSVTRDVTKIKQMEEEQRKAQRLSSLGVLAGGIAHDFNNILTILFGNISLARSYLTEDHESKAALDKAEAAYHRAIHLTSQLLTFAKGGEPVRQNISMRGLIEEVTRFDLSGSNVKLVLDLPDDLWFAEVDRGQIVQVFSNLTTNANQAMPKGGHVFISAENCELATNEIKGLVSGRYIRFTVSDEGAGIAHEDIENIFDPYFSTKQTGSGLGLATVYSVIQRHGGLISVSSQPGQGACFVFYLPATEQKEGKHASGRVQKLQPVTERKGRILVMDDEEMICDLARHVLESAGYDVDLVNEGQKAVEKYTQAMEAGLRFDCMIMDLTIPGGMGGADAMRQILEFDSKATAIVSSGYAADPIMANYRDYGFSGYLVKPFTLASLRHAVQDILQSR